uniref:Midasin n=1 Tax=Angiostrongylus cantonensis TaxID=6313 RepID=A0A0K0CYC0_ANGCA
MVNGIKRRLKTQKRKVEVCYDGEMIDVPSQRRKLGDSKSGDEFGIVVTDRMVLPTREFLAYELIVALRAKQFVIIEGPIGCGKTFIASYASRHLNLPLRVMQMGDQIDSKSLFGMYHCTEVAGEFLWKPSSFSQWLSEACLVLLEDIDLSNADVISTVVQLASIRSGMLPFGGNLTLHEDVRIVSTVSDLLRACSRLSELPDLSSNTSIFAELVDTWCLASPYERAFALCLKVAAPLSITTDQVSFHLSLRQPTFSHDDGSCTIGRCRLPRSLSLKNVYIHRLGHTRDVLQLMERLAVCVRNREPVLLVGETGVGKTAVVQSLASTLNITLKVVNLSPSSDPDELIGGYKPTTISQVLEPFTHFYHSVFKSSFDIVKNRKFLDHLEACLSSGRYRDYLSLAIATAEKALRKRSLKEDTRWASVIVRARRMRSGLDRGAVPFVTSRGAVIEAAEDGHWLLIDEINLAPPESLDAIVHTISRNVHPNFRLFACMNPCTDVGKRRLPTSVRTRFTEFYVGEMSDAHQLAVVVSAYLPSMKPTLVTKLVNFYLQAKQLYPTNYSLRTFCRALLFTAQNMFGNEERSLYEAVEGYWIERGTELPNPDGSYVLTKTVKSNLAEIARITSSGRFPILLEGETSVGKTSIICHLARMTGNVITRINNHEYTDIQEYIGSYVADTQGRLIFREGALVKAVRNGGWVILDELNLAPSDVIEALNRLLDDNQELFIPELNTVIQAHPRFRLFATQNPAGCYGGRKRLSRALMSRFVVLRFSQLPMEELSSMVLSERKVIRVALSIFCPSTFEVCARSGVHKSAATKMINVLSKLRLKRSVGGVFSATDSLMTLRDVFRWAKRLVTDSTSDDWLQILANHGYFLLAGRCRNRRDSNSVVETLQNELGRNIEPIKLFAIDSPYMPKDIDTEGIVMTMSMRRMLVMTEQAWLRNEAILMVGETGGGKTTLAHLMGRGNLSTINCHERTETTDLLGRLRPREDGGFAWSDGVVVSAMKAGVPLLIDEISLAEDSVLERLNPLFEEERTLLLSDAGIEVHSVSARDGFQIIATMNPGGDYGKKELSKALRNRFTEIWSCCDFEECELLKIFESRLSSTPEESLGPPQESPAELVVNWIAKFSKKYLHVFRHSPSVRDIIACAEIYSACTANGFLRTAAVFEAVSAVFLDALNMQKLRMTMDIKEIRRDGEDMTTKFLLQIRLVFQLDQLSSDVIVRSPIPSEILIASDYIKIGAFSVSFGPLDRAVPKGFSFRAPTCVSNFYRIARALLINKPILLEGAPGCGKSSTIMALAALTGHPITRLNLSDQTDLSDLFGSDVPIVSEDGSISFQWVDGPILSAIKCGEWVLLDEMNLAPQAVLEGLNACFDHRRMLYVAELNRSFQIPPGTNCRFFACQNPHAQGGNRRALPKSFVNRFTSIYIEDLLDEDILLILHELPAAVGIGRDHLKAMISITAELSADQSLFGAPFSFNLRDLLRWVQLFEKIKDMQVCFQVLFLNRMRREEDRKRLRDLYSKFFGEPCIAPPLALSVDDKEVRLGKVCLARSDRKCELFNSSHRLLSSQFALMHQLAVCVDMQWMALIIGPRNSGKRSTLQNLADICGVQLQTIVLNSETDAQELIGSYEQSIDDYVINDAKQKLYEILSAHVEETALKEVRNAEDLSQLETITEIVLSNIKDNNDVVDECHLVLARSARSSMRFEWVDSPFVRAYLNGHWLLIEDVNLCSAAVLDRLNSCLENDGRLVVFERHSSFKPLEAHPNFRYAFFKWSSFLKKG